MINVFIRHRVKDYPAWKKVFDAFAPQRRAGGEKSYWIARVPGEPQNLCLSFEWDTVANAQKFLASAELAKEMQKAGVSDKPEIFISEEMTKGKT